MNRICLYIRRLRQKRGRLWGQNHGVRISVRRGIALSVSSGVGAGLFSVWGCACLWVRAVRRVAACGRRSHQHSTRLWSGRCGRSNERRPVRRGGHCGAVEIYDVVIAYVAPAVAFGFRRGVPLSYLLHGEGLSLRGGRAMHDDFGYASHKVMRVMGLCLRRGLLAVRICNDSRCRTVPRRR